MTGVAAARGSQRRALVVVCSILALTFLDTTVVSVALGSIQSSMHLTVTRLQWVVDAYAVAFASLMLTGGTLGDRFGRRRVMLLGLATFAAGSLLGAVATSGGTLIASRAVMGVGAAASEPGTLSVLRHIFPEHRGRARALGVWAAVSCLGLALGPLIGGVLVSLWDWRAVFWLNVVAGVVLNVLARRHIPESADPHAAPVDLPGQLLAIASIAMIVIAVIQGEQTGYRDPLMITLFVLGGICSVFFVLWERRTPTPMLQLRYFRNVRFTAALVVAFAVYFGTFSIFFFTALYLEVVDHYSGYHTALLFLPMTALMVGGAVGGGWLVVHRHGRWTMAGGTALSAIGIALSEPLLTPHAPFATLTLTLALTGLGMGTAMVPVTSAVLEVVPPEHSGMAASATNTARQLGVVFGVAVLGALVNAHLTQDLSARLSRLGIPKIFYPTIIDAVERGTTPAGVIPGQTGPFHEIVEHVVSAAFVAFHDGLRVALIISSALIGAAAVVAVVAARRTPHDPQ